MHVDAELCGGSIHVVRQHHGAAADLALRHDSASQMRQWFHFRVQGARDAEVELAIVNAGEATFSNAFHGFRALASYDLERWFRVPTDFDGRRLVVRHRPERDSVFYGYWAAHSLDRHHALVARAAQSSRTRTLSIGRSVEGRSIDLVSVGHDGPGKRRVWLAARQHPGETMSSFFAEGALDRLLDERDGLSNALLGEAVVYVVPNMNPDGSTRGNFRTNAAGRDLNREWSFPNRESSPEVLAVRSAMEEAGVDLFLDLHGDESAACIFAIGCEGNPRYSERLYRLERSFAWSLAGRDGGFSPDYNYGPDDPGKGDLSIGNNWVGERFDCLSMTIEMPFKDLHPAEGFSPDRARALGRSSLESIFESLGALR
jgi:murein tripeptide amidase MpaA